MRTIHKQTLKPVGKQELLVPYGAVFLSVQIQNGDMRIWYLCDDKATMSHRTIIIHGTGHKIEEHNLAFIGTILLNEHTIVFHIFEELK